MNFKNRIIRTGTADPKTLKANTLNWRKHPDAQRKAMRDVLGNVGWIQDVIINETTGNIIDGHLRVETAIKNKETEIPVKYVELSEDEEKTALATFDPITAMAEQDDELLKKLLADANTDIDLSQFHDDYDKLVKPQHTEEELDAVPDVPKVAKTKRGDVYKLGDHVLMCGDSTNADDVARLMQGEKAANGDAFKREYDDIKREYYATRAYFDNTHEGMTNVFHDSIVSTSTRVKEGIGHATPKPISICCRAIKSSSREGELVLDVFGGSGSTLIACEETGRKCRMMELAPEYCDVIVERWEKLTGKKAERLT